jgi:hypothetical protein
MRRARSLAVTLPRQQPPQPPQRGGGGGAAALQSLTCASPPEYCVVPSPDMPRMALDPAEGCPPLPLRYCSAAASNADTCHVTARDRHAHGTHARDPHGWGVSTTPRSTD